MPHDAYSWTPAGSGLHTHAHLDAATIATAKVSYLSTRHRDAMGNPRVISHDHRLTCCGRLVSSLAVGEIVPDAD